MSASMIFFERARHFFRRLPRLRFLRPFAIFLDWGTRTYVSAPGRMIATLRVRGTGNSLSIDPSSSFMGHITLQGHNNRIIIGKNCELAGEIIVKGRNQTVSIGDETTFVSVYVLCMENRDITIGRCCMFSRDIEISHQRRACADRQKKWCTREPGRFDYRWRPCLGRHAGHPQQGHRHC